MKINLTLPAVFVLVLASSCVEADSPAKEASGNLAALQEMQSLEKAVLEHLSAGRQREAENLLEEGIAREPEIERIISLVDEGDEEAKKLFAARPDWFRDRQRSLFLLAACHRSRFDKEGAFPIFRTVYGIDSTTPSGLCAMRMIKLDYKELTKRGRRYINNEFVEFEKLADANADDLIIRWMLAVECRTWDKNELGAKQYQKILETWKPGPVLVHQTYANLLDELKRYEESLAERRIALEMEPAGWSYDGMGNTLHLMSRFREAEEAHAKATELNPSSARHWSNWASTLHDEGQHDEAIEKCKRALELDPKSMSGMWIWAECLESQNKKAESLEKYEELLVIYPKDLKLQLRIAALRKELEK
jgi:tetratricopeptide (TPR) repeat protein